MGLIALHKVYGNRSSKPQVGGVDKSRLAACPTNLRDTKRSKVRVIEEYKVLCVNPKWMLETAHTAEQVARRASIAQQSLVRAKLERVAKASPA